MKVTFLGTGTSQGIPIVGCGCEVCHSTDSRDKRLRCSIVVELDSGFRVVIDSGPDFRTQLLNTGIDDFDAILITHEHRDHTAGLDDVRPINFIKGKKIPVYATAYVQSVLKKHYDYIFSEEKYYGQPEVTLVEISADQPFYLDGQRVTPIEVEHGTFSCLGFRFGNFAYITDASFISEKELGKLGGLDVLVINSLQKDKHHSHFSLDESLEVIEKLKPKTAYLTHLSHKMGFHAEVEKELPPHVRIAYDGQTIENL